MLQDANDDREKIAKQQFERQEKEYEIAWGQELTKYAWDQAKVEVERLARSPEESDL